MRLGSLPPPSLAPACGPRDPPRGRGGRPGVCRPESRPRARAGRAGTRSATATPGGGGRGGQSATGMARGRPVVTPLRRAGLEPGVKSSDLPPASDGQILVKMGQIMIRMVNRWASVDISDLVPAQSVPASCRPSMVKYWSNAGQTLVETGRDSSRLVKYKNRSRRPFAGPSPRPLYRTRAKPLPSRPLFLDPPPPL